MPELLNAVAFGSAVTALFAFRFSVKPWVLVSYFAVFTGLDYVVFGYFLPEGTFPDVMAIVLFVIAALFVVAGIIRRRFAPPGDGEI